MVVIFEMQKEISKVIYNSLKDNLHIIDRVLLIAGKEKDKLYLCQMNIYETGKIILWLNVDQFNEISENGITNKEIGFYKNFSEYKNYENDCLKYSYFFNFSLETLNNYTKQNIKTII
tara:strand:+ start:112 stop:465 length:354 start_codon:yes stop_codon:yes gene_type:complete